LEFRDELTGNITTNPNLGREDVDRIKLAKDTSQWQNLVNSVMKLRVP
jgi:hypothetical protein